MEGLPLDYIAGFFDGEGSIIVRFKRDKRYRAGYQLIVKLALYQKRRDILERINASLGINGKIYYHKRDMLWYLEIYKFKDIRKFIEQIAGRVVVKKEQIEKLSKILSLMDRGLHLDPEGIKLIEAVWRTPGTGANPR